MIFRQLPIVVIFLLTGLLSAQERYLDKSGVVVFEASEELFEPVKAKNESVTVILDPQEHTVASLALIRGFVFENSLMQEHFNENYIESDRFPKAIFKGEILDFDITHLNESTREYTIRGTLEVRGNIYEISPVVEIQKVGDVISIQGGFSVKPGYFDIKIPKIVENKIAKTVQVSLDFKLAKQ